VLTLISALVALAVGGAAAWLAHSGKLRDYYGNVARITKREFALGSVVVVGLAVAITMWIGPNLARSSAVNGYHEFYNGSVTQAVAQVINCSEDGPCVHEFTCNEVYHPAVTDSKGNVTQAAYIETHDCPYVTQEVNYVLETSIGQTAVIGSHYFTENPQRWTESFGDDSPGVPGGVLRQPPQRWLKARQSLAAGVPDPVTGVFSYANYILAADSDLYKQYDGHVARYQQTGLLPKHTVNLDNDNMLYDYGMQAAKVQAVGGLKLANLSTWQDRLMRFNAALGSDLQGDLHIVLVPAARIANPDEYITSLKAYWQNLGKWSISKNGIILVIGASPDGSTVEWSRAATGMPAGNGEMLEALKLKLTDSPLDPSILLGSVGATVHESGGKPKVIYDHNSAGTIGKVVFTDYPFARPCMKCEGANDKGVGYVDLKDFVPVSTGSKILMFFIVLVLSCLCWAAMVLFDPFGSDNRPGNNYPRRPARRAVHF
jgi:hypothetical protein